MTNEKNVKNETGNALKSSQFMILDLGIGGADRDRTDDLHNAIVALFQLSYGPQIKLKYLPKLGRFVELKRSELIKREDLFLVVDE